MARKTGTSVQYRVVNSRRTDALGVDAVGGAVALGLFLFLCLVDVLAKAYALSRIPPVATTPHEWLIVSIGALRDSRNELIIAAVISGGLAISLRAVRSKLLQTVITASAALLAVVVALLNLSAAELLRVFGALPSVGLLLYSDLFFSVNGRVTVLSWTPPWLMEAAILSVVCGLAVALTGSRLRQGRVWRAFFWLLMFGVPALATVLHAAITLSADPIYERSATVNFVKSARILEAERILDDSGAAPAIPKGLWQPGASWSGHSKAKIRNMLLIVVESGGAQYFDQYGGKYTVTPSLSTSRLQADNAYSQAVATTLSMGVLLTSRFPELTALQQEPHGVMLPQVLHSRGWSTGFFFSTDVRYQGADKWLAGSGFDVIRDYRSRRCFDAPIEDVSELNSQATTDACTFAQMEHWIENNRARPFFATLWTFQTHYPYFETGSSPRVNLGSELRANPDVRTWKERYLTALRETDAQIAGLLEFLDRLHLRDDTLVIVTGDHGEAFLQHGTTGHGYNLYEESVRVPLLLLNPGFGGTQHFGRLTGHIDIAPTIVDLLGIQPPSGWQGTSMFRPRQIQPIYFVSPWSDLLVGYRLGNEKVAAALLGRSAARYDLARDPGERTNLSLHDPGWQGRQIASLAAWARAQNEIAAKP